MHTSGGHTGSGPASGGLVWIVIALACGWCVSAPAADAVAEGFRVESEVYANGAQEPVARTLTLFRGRIAWDFIETVPSAASDRPQAGAAVTEIVLHDPARERVVVVDPVRNMKTQVDAIRLERLSASLAAWARRSDDRLVRWAGGPDFADGMKETADMVELAGPRVRYAVEYAIAPSADEADSYRQFADTAILLKGLMRPGGLPPFPRMAINRRVAAAGGIPTSVALEIDPGMAAFTGRAARLRCTHRFHPRLLSSDLARIAEAESRVAAATAVDLAEFVAAPQPDD
jgi:hypothetical protein